MIKYCSGYKYQLRDDVHIQTYIEQSRDIRTPLVELRSDGLLTIKRFFAWDGCSGPTIDTMTNARAGLAHDALYFLIRVGLLPRSFKVDADLLLERLMIEDGELPLRAKYYWLAVDLFGGNALRGTKKIIVAPKKG
jgi:hypothetical protein